MNLCSARCHTSTDMAYAFRPAVQPDKCRRQIATGGPPGSARCSGCVSSAGSRRRQCLRTSRTAGRATSVPDKRCCPNRSPVAWLPGRSMPGCHCEQRCNPGSGFAQLPLVAARADHVGPRSAAAASKGQSPVVPKSRSGTARRHHELKSQRRSCRHAVLRQHVDRERPDGDEGGAAKVRKTGRGQASDGKSADDHDRNENLLRSFARRNHVTLAATRALFTVFGESDDAAKCDESRTTSLESD